MRWLRHAAAAGRSAWRRMTRRLAAAGLMRKRRQPQPAALPAIRPGTAAELRNAWAAAAVPDGPDRFAAEAGAALGTVEGDAALGTVKASAPAPPAVRRPDFGPLGPAPGTAEGAIVHRIRRETERLIRNNVTRTEAYRSFWLRHPGVHWALLAHMVSRNGGWNMTDLRGEWLPRLLGPGQREHLFRMLERSNALIFRDAYPQLLLFEESLRLGRDLSHLLPAFGVSRFMEPVWRQFLRSGDSAALTTALIVNEQHVVEHHVVRHRYYREFILEKLFFRLQGLLQLNQVVFPYFPERPGRPGSPDGLRLIGLTIERFTDLDERIACGKRLYAMLFDGSDAAAAVHRFARGTRHTGSRADYAPHLFAPERTGPPEQPYRLRLDGLRLRPGAEPVYSPALAGAWPDRPVHPPPPGDWFDRGSRPSRWFESLPAPGERDMTGVHAAGFAALERAAAAASRLFPNRPLHPGT